MGFSELDAALGNIETRDDTGENGEKELVTDDEVQEALEEIQGAAKDHADTAKENLEIK